MTTYSISLDDVDLAFLPLRTHRYNDFLKKEHFQFEVMKKDNVEDSVSTVFYTCHVCAIEVPASFASEHVASIKHRANARIASVAMQRTRNLISSLPPPFSETIHPPSGRFCTNCAIVADEDHDKTKDHRVAAMHDHLLWDLMKAYVGELGDEESKDDYKGNITTKDRENNRIGDNKRDENDGNNAKEEPISSPESTRNNNTFQGNDKHKMIDNISHNSINNDINNSTAAIDATPSQEPNIKQKKKKSKGTTSIQETAVSNCEITRNKSLEKHHTGEEFMKVEARKNDDSITKQTELNTGKNKYIPDTSKHQNIRSPNDSTEIHQSETKQHDSKHANKNIISQSINNSIMMPKNSLKSLDVLTNKTYVNEPRNYYDYDSWSTYEYFITNEIYSYIPYESELRKSCNNTTTTFKHLKNEMYININDYVHLVIENDNFHSYRRIYDSNAIGCLVCNLIIDVKHEILHTKDKHHMMRISNIGQDDNYIRKLNDTDNHCILCNELIHYTYMAQHKQDLYHLRRKETNLFIFPTDRKQPETLKVFCPEYLKAKGIQSSIPVIHKEMGDEDETNDNGIDSKISEIGYPYEVRFGQIRCVICQCRVPRDLQNRIAHTIGAKHTKKMKLLMSYTQAGT